MPLRGTGFVAVPGGRIVHELGGPAVPLLVIHGGPGVRGAARCLDASRRPPGLRTISSAPAGPTSADTTLCTAALVEDIDSLLRRSVLPVTCSSNHGFGAVARIRAHAPQLRVRALILAALRHAAMVEDARTSAALPL